MFARLSVDRKSVDCFCRIDYGYDCDGNYECDYGYDGDYGCDHDYNYDSSTRTGRGNRSVQCRRKRF